MLILSSNREPQFFGMKTHVRHIARLFGLVLLCQGLLLSRVEAQEKVTLQLKWTHAFQFAGYYAAIEKGYYRDAGLDVTIVEANPDTDPVSEVLEGKAQYGVGSSGLLLSRAAGKPVVVLAVIFQHSPYEIYASTEIHHLNDLIGKRMMLEPQSEEIIAYLKKEGIPLDSLTLLPHTFSADALINNQTEAMSGYLSSEPYFFGLAKYPYQIFSPQSAGIDFYGDNLFTSAQELAKFPARVKAFRDASLKGWLYAKNHHDEIIDLIYYKYSKSNTLDYLRFESEQMIPLLQPDLVDIGYMNLNRWKHIARTYESIGLLKADFSLAGFIYNPDERNLKGLYLTLGIAVLIIFSISSVTFYIFRVNRKLALSIKKINQSDKILSESEKSYHGLFNSVTDAIYIQDENGCFMDVNAGVEKMYGYSRNEIIGHTPEFLSAPGLNDLSKIKELLNITFITGEPQLFEFWGKRKNGEIFPKEVICNQGRYFGKDVIITTARDVTDRKRTDGTLRETNAYLENLINYANAPIIVWDAQFHITRFNHAFEYLTGLKESEIIGQSLELVFPPNLANPALSQIHKTHTGERWETVEIEILHRDNSRRTVLWNSATIFSTDGKTPIATIAQGQDITGRKQTEAKLRNLFENAPIGIFHSMPGGRFITANPPLAKMLGYSSPEELVELISDMSTQIYVDPSLRHDQIKKLMNTEEWVHREDVLWRCKDGSLINVDMTGRKVLNPDGSIAYLEGFIKDITEQKKAEQEIKLKNEELSELNATKDKFFSIIAHDLKSPFNSIMGFSQLLVEQVNNKDYDGLGKYAGIILHSSEKAVSLLMNLMDWARSQTGRMEFIPEYFELVDFINEIITIFNDIAGQKSITIFTGVPPNAPVFADRAMINTVLRNLISNAIKFTRPGGMITITATEKPDLLMVSVRDTGVGIPKDKIDKLFRIDENYSTRGTANETGTGLGLILCKEFIEKHNGEIWIESKEGTGSIFYFTLPFNTEPIRETIVRQPEP